MQQKQNKLTMFILILSGLGMIALRQYLVGQVIVLGIGLGAMFYTHRYMRDKFRVELENEKKIVKDKASTKTEDAMSKLNAIIEAIPSALVYINERGEFEVANRKFNAILNIDAINVYDSDIEGSLRQILLDAFLNEKQFIRQQKFEDVDYQVLAVPMLKNNRYDGCMIIMQDVTRLVDGERMQQRFIADASHELKTPIASIKGMIEIINRDDFNDDQTLEEFLAQIQIESSRLETIVDDLLLQSKLTADKVHLEKTEFNLKQFFDGLTYEKRR